MAKTTNPSGETTTPRPAPRATTPTAKAWQWWLLKLIVPGLVLVVGLVLIVALGLAQRLGWISAEGVAVSGAAAAEAGQVYTCPMHPQIRQPAPGRCPICGMALVPTSAGGADLDELSVKVEPAQRRLANIQTAVARRGPVVDAIETVGAIAIDESRMATIAAYVQGRLERLFADYTGVDVAKGDHLAVIYSPQLYAAQVEYIESRRAFQSMNQATLEVVRQTQQRLVASSHQNLVELGMTEQQIRELEQSGKAMSRLTIYSPIGGTVIEKPAVEGKYVEAGEPIYRIADLSTVWLMLEIFPEDAARVRFGQEVTAEVQSLPGETFHGRIAFVQPTVDSSKRTVGVRVEFLNQQRRLRPGDYARATITVPIGQTGQVYDADLAGRWISPMHPQIIRDEPGECPICGMDLVPTSRYGYAESPVPQPTALYIPRSALLMAGDNSVVYVETEPGRFTIRPVVVGPILSDKVVILEGLAEGDAVATSGNFLIDSQMQLAGKPSLIDPSRAVAKQGGAQEGPLQFDEIEIESVEGATGEKLEQLYDGYFAVKNMLSSDRKPSEQQATALHALAKQLAADDALPEASRSLLGEVSANSEHLHHMELKQARQAFKPMSQAIVKLASRWRGEQAKNSLVHFYCPHVPGGGGDWLQADDQLLNPYFGSQMLRCGSQEHEFPAQKAATPRNPASAEVDPTPDTVPPDRGPPDDSSPDASSPEASSQLPEGASSAN
ncbi:MAG: efflux RND transporter periplasmic adaptor subunit [Pirellulaceae bacterium]